MRGRTGSAAAHTILPFRTAQPRGLCSLLRRSAAGKQQIPPLRVRNDNHEDRNDNPLAPTQCAVLARCTPVVIPNGAAERNLLLACGGDAAGGQQIPSFAVE